MGVADGADTRYLGTRRRITASTPSPSFLVFFSYHASSLLVSLTFLPLPRSFLRTNVTCKYHSGAHVAREAVTEGTVSLLFLLSGGQCCIGPFKGLTLVMQINRRETSKVAHYARDNSLFFNCLVPVARLRPWKIAMCVNVEQAPLV